MRSSVDFRLVYDSGLAIAEELSRVGVTDKRLTQMGAPTLGGSRHEPENSVVYFIMEQEREREGERIIKVIFR